MSSIQFNLLPDSKLAYNQAQTLRKRVMGVALIASTVSVALFVVLLVTVYGVQKKELTDTAKQVDAATAKLKAIPNIDTVLTVQNQIKALSQLHQSKHISSRIFTYLPQLTPADVNVNKLDLDMKQNILSLSGTSSSQHSVSTFVANLKAANYKAGSDSPAPAFSSVVESGFNISSTNISYTINMQFDPKIFANNILDANGKPQTPTLVISSSGSTKSPFKQ